MVNKVYQSSILLSSMEAENLGGQRIYGAWSGESGLGRFLARKVKVHSPTLLSRESEGFDLLKWGIFVRI